MNRYQLGLYEKAMPAELSWRDMLLCAGTVGFDYVEISIDESDSRLARLNWSPAERAHLVHLMQDTGVPIRSMCLSAHRKYPLGSHDAAIRSQSLSIMKQAVHLAEDLGIRTIQLAGYDVYYEKGDAATRQFFIENLHKAVEMAAAAGVILGFETMETAFMNTVKKAMSYVSLIDSPYLSVYPDIGNITNAAKSSGDSVLDDLCAGRGHLVAMHLKETVPGVFREVTFGTGHVDFPSAINAAWQLGVRRYVTEMWYTGQQSWREDISCAYQMMSAILNSQKGGAQ